MCGRYVLSQPGDVLDETLESLEGYELDGGRARLEASLSEPRFNVAPTQVMPILFPGHTSEGATKRCLDIDGARWDFAQANRQSKRQPGRTLINARCETIAERPSFKSSFEQRRCLVPATGFYEWRPKGNRQPFFFRLPAASQRVGFCFAGLWQRGEPRDRNTPRLRFCIVTGKAGPRMAQIHHRRPVILRPDSYSAWIDPEQSTDSLLDLLHDNDPELEEHPVSFDVNRVTNDRPDLVEQVREAPTNLSLF